MSDQNMPLEPDGSELTKRQDLEDSQPDEAADEATHDAQETAEKTKPPTNAPQIQFENMMDLSLN